MDEIKHVLKSEFLLLIENEILLTWYKPKDLWIRFGNQSQAIKWQTYSLIRELERFGYVRKKYDESGNVVFIENGQYYNLPKEDHYNYIKQKVEQEAIDGGLYDELMNKAERKASFGRKRKFHCNKKRNPGSKHSD